VHFINHFEIMTLFYAPPWRAFLNTNYLIIYVSLKEDREGIGRVRMSRGELKRRRCATSRSIVQVGPQVYFFLSLFFYKCCFYYAYFFTSF